MIRSLSLLALSSGVAALAFACGGSQPAPTSTPEPAPTSTEATPTAPSAPAPTATATTVATAPAPTATATAAAPVAGPTTLKGKLGGKDFDVKTAYAMMGAKPNQVLLELTNQPQSCGALAQTAGATKLGLVLTWQEGTTVDPKTLKGGKQPEAYIMVFTKKFDNKDWKASGKVEVVRAPKKGGEFGRVRFDTKAGADTLTGEIDVKVCGDLP
jgi:hypothetical protein